MTQTLPKVTVVKAPPPPVERVVLEVSEGVAKALQYLMMHNLTWEQSPHNTELNLLYDQLYEAFGPNVEPLGYRTRRGS